MQISFDTKEQSVVLALTEVLSVHILLVIVQ